MTCQLPPVFNMKCPQRRIQQLRRQFRTPRRYHLPQTQMVRDPCCRLERRRVISSIRHVRRRAFPPHFKPAMPSFLSKQQFCTTAMSAKTMIAHSPAGVSTYRGVKTETDVAHAGQKESTVPKSPSANDSKRKLPLKPTKSRDHILASASESSEEELAVAALLAHLSSLAYYPDPSEHLRALGLHLVASGETGFTSYYIADGPDPATWRFFHPSSKHQSTNAGNVTHRSEPHVDIASPESAERKGMQMTRFVITRGVAWSRPSVDSQLLWRQLSKFWPTTIKIPANRHPSGESGGSVVAHAGIKEIADEIYDLITPHLAVDFRRKGISTVRFGGHSMGGSVALLLLTRLQKEGGLKPFTNSPTERCGDDTWQAVPGVSVHTFGSPPVLAQAEVQEEGGVGWPTRLMPRWTDWMAHQPEVNVKELQPTPHGNQYFGRSRAAIAGDQGPSGGSDVVPPRGSEPPFRGTEGPPSGNKMRQAAVSPKKVLTDFSETERVRLDRSTGGASSIMPPVTIPVLPPHSTNGSLSGIGQRLVPTTAAAEPLSATPPTCGIQNVLGLPYGSVQAYVHDQDIVARAGLAADPLYGLAMNFGWVKAVLELRGRVLGSGGVLTAERFLFQTAGEVHFMRSKGSRAMVCRLDKSEADVVLKMNVADLISRPVSLVKTITDHSHQGYADGLRSALAFKSRWSGQGGGR